MNTNKWIARMDRRLHPFEPMIKMGLATLALGAAGAWIIWDMWPSESPSACFTRMANGVPATDVAALKKIYQSCKDTDERRVAWRAFWNIVD